jgi:hypothetical protein
MNRYTVIHTLSRTRTIVETVEVESVVEAESFTAAASQAESLSPDFDEDEYEVLSEEVSSSTETLDSISFSGAVAAAVVSERGLDGLPPAVYDSEPAPSGAPYSFVQVEPTPSGL